MSADAFDAWLFKNGIRIPKSLKTKMEDKYVASTKVLSALKDMGGNALKEVAADMKLNTVENAIFNVIISELSGSEGSSVPTGHKSQDKITTIVPEILSISDNKNGAVNIEWKLVQKALNNDTANRLKLEWAQDEKALDFDYTNDQIIDLNRIDLNVVHKSNVLVKDINANKFRLKWRNFSGVKTLKLTSDRWDANNKGSKIQIQENIIKHTATNVWSSVYGQVVCKPPFTYHWQFKIKSYAVHMMFAVAKESDGYKWKENYLGCQGMGYYQNGQTYLYNTYAGGQHLAGGNYGHERFGKNGDVLDMYLDLKNHTLTYKTGGKDIGFVYDTLPQENYRMIVSLYNQQQIELTAFDYN